MADKKLSALEVKRINRRKIFNYLYKNASHTKQEIAHALHMSYPTVAQNIQELTEAGLVTDTGEYEATGGRSAQKICCNSKARFAIGLDITKPGISAVLIDLEGNVVSSMKRDKMCEDSQEYFRYSAELVKELVKIAEIPAEKILGVGIAVPAVLTKDGLGTEESSPLGIEQLELRDFAQYMEFPCTLRNDADASGEAEIWSRDNVDDMLYLSLNNSVGGCIIYKGQLNIGQNHKAGEFGHMTIDASGELCHCGKRGCFDVYCNAYNLSREADGDLDSFFEKFRAGDENCRKVWEKYLSYLALGVNNLRMIFDCDIVIGGYVGEKMNAEEMGMLRRLASERNTFKEDGSYISHCEFKSGATAVGAALYYINTFREKI